MFCFSSFLHQLNYLYIHIQPAFCIHKVLPHHPPTNPPPPPPQPNNLIPPSPPSCFLRGKREIRRSKSRCGILTDQRPLTIQLTKSHFPTRVSPTRRRKRTVDLLPRLAPHQKNPRPDQDRRRNIGNGLTLALGSG